MQSKEIIINEELQERIFGKRYRGATKAKVILSLGEGQRLFQWINKPRNFLIILGPPGVGKTYILSAIVGECHDKFRFIRAYNEREYLGIIREGISKYETYDYIKEIQRLTDNDLFILDDLGSSAKTEWRNDVIMETLDFCYRENKSCILTSNFSKNDFYENYHSRVCSRIFAKENTIVNLEDMEDLRLEGN